MNERNYISTYHLHIKINPFCVTPHGRLIKISQIEAQISDVSLFDDIGAAFRESNLIFLAAQLNLNLC